MHPARAYCERHGITQSELARRAGISAPYLSELIHGRERVGAGAARRLRDAMGGEVTLEDLLDWQPAGGWAA